MEPVLVILDLNGTLLHTTHQRKDGYDYRTRYKYIFYRPGMWDFLKFLNDHSRVKLAVWTSCTSENAQTIVKRVFYRIPLEFCFSREDCIEVPGPGYKTIKDLTRVWKRFPLWNKSNTIMIDDSADKLQEQPDNLIQVTEFIGEDRISDTALADLQKKLANLLHNRPCPSSESQDKVDS